MKVILPNIFVDDHIVRIGPLFFTAGPDRGGSNWQERFCESMRCQLADFTVAVPCRWRPDAKFANYCLAGDENKLRRQKQWERYYIEMSLLFSKTHQGCLIFWLPAEDKKNPRDDGKPYAMDTRGELGRWGKFAAITRSHLIIGGETGFPGLRSIREDFRLDFNIPNGEQFPFCTSLEEVVEKSFQWVKPMGKI